MEGPSASGEKLQMTQAQAKAHAMAQAKVRIAEMVLQERQQELDTSRMREQEMERKVLGLTKALSEARMEASGLGQMADADKRAYFSKKLASQLQAKRAALQQATSRRHELSQKLDQVRRKKPKEAPQEKLKEALRIVAELTYSLSHTTATNKNLREQLETQRQQVQALLPSSAPKSMFTVQEHKPSLMDRFLW